MNFLAASLASPASRAKDLSEKLMAATLEADVMDTVGEIAKFVGADQENKRHFGEHLGLLFKAIERPDELDESRPGLLDILLELVTIRDPSKDAKPTSPNSIMNGNINIPTVDGASSASLRGPGLGGRGAATFSWLQVPLEMADSILKNIEWMAILLNLLTEKKHWTRRSTLNLLSSLLDSRPMETEEAIVHSNTGMQSILDLLDDLDERYSVQALLLLEKLTHRSTHFRKYIFAFRDGFSKLFQIIRAEDTDFSVIRDCLSVLNNAMGASRVLQDRFFECGCADDLAVLFKRLLGPRGSLSHTLAELPDPVAFEPLKSSALQALHNALRLVWCLTAGFAPETAKLEHGGDAFTLPDELHSDLSSQKPLQGAQERVGRADGVLHAIATTALVLRQRDISQETGNDNQDTEDSLTITVRCAALKVLGDLCANHPKNRNRFLGLQLVASHGSLAVESDFRYIVDPNWEGIEDATLLRFGALDGVMRVALFAYGEDDLAAANYCIAALLHGSSDFAITIIGHALQPPPDAEPVVNRSRFELISSPTAGRILVETVVKTSTLVHEIVKNTINETDLKSRVEFLRYSMWRSGRLFEKILASDTTCQIISAQLLVSSNIHDQSVDGDTSSQEHSLACVMRQLLLTLQLANYKGFRIQPLDTETNSSTDNKQATLLKDVAALYHALAVSLLRVVCVWSFNCDSIASEIATSPANLFLFSLAGSRTQHGVAPQSLGEQELQVLGMSCLSAGNCVVSCSPDLQPKVFSMVTRMIGLQDIEANLNALSRSNAFQLTRRSLKALERDGLARQAYEADSNLFDKEFVEFFTKCHDAIKETIFELYTGGGNTVAPNSSSTVASDPNGSSDGTTVQAATDSERFLVSQMDHLKEFIRIQDVQLKEKEKYIKELEQGTTVNIVENPSDTSKTRTLEDEIAKLELRCAKLQEENERLTKCSEPQNSVVDELKVDHRTPDNERVNVLFTRIERLVVLLSIEQIAKRKLLEHVRVRGGEEAVLEAIRDMDSCREQLVQKSN